MTPPFRIGKSLEELIDQGVLNEGMREVFSDALPGTRPLYRHQELAIRRAIAGRNLVIATGTGSGKTESFLVPILNHLVAERAASSLGPGVRALLLYPMNALANDQLERISLLLASAPDITFGRYTGETIAGREAAETSSSSNTPDHPFRTSCFPGPRCKRPRLTSS